MVCKNCGADLKPGIKYCLECGNYIDDDDDDEYLDEESDEISTSYRPVTLRDGGRKKKRLNLTTSDYLIYAGLLIVMIGSIIVIVVALVKDKAQSKMPEVPTEIVEQDKLVTIDNYTVTVPGKLNSTVQDSTLYVSDNVNYTFSYQNTVDDFDAYAADRSLLEAQLSNNKYEVISASDKTVNSRLFLLYEIKVNGVQKVLYLTKANSKYTTMGIIEIMSSDNWSEALPVIDTINNSISFDVTS